MKRHQHSQRLLYLASLMVLALPLLLYSNGQRQRPPRIATETPLFSGVTYTREIYTEPRPYVVHRVEIDLTAPGIDVVVSPGLPALHQYETKAQRTTTFLTQNQLQLAINASFFYAFEEATPWNFYPRVGDPVQVLGQARASGADYSPPHPRWTALCFTRAPRVSLARDGTCPAATWAAVSGSHVLVSAGQPLVAEASDRAYARTAVAFDRQGETLWLLVVDGKQPHYSEGATLTELAEIAVALGAETALNLDGGGSATLAIATPEGTQLLNAPIHAKLPLWERPVANQLGFRAQGLGNPEP